jgi:hypothetical protein
VLLLWNAQAPRLQIVFDRNPAVLPAAKLAKLENPASTLFYGNLGRYGVDLNRVVTPGYCSCP